MTNPSSGVVVDRKDNGIRYAVSHENFDPRVHVKVRDLKPGETVRGFVPKRRALPKPAVRSTAKANTSRSRNRARVGVGSLGSIPTKGPSTEGTEETTNRKD